jgi:hypothetical protein
MALFVLGILAVPISAFSQGAADLEKSLLAAPPAMKDAATVIKWKADYTYDTVRKGTNRLVCFDISGMPGQTAFSVECTSIANLDRVAQNLKFESEPDRAKRKEAVSAAEKNGTRVKAEFGSMWLHLRGADQASARMHTTVAVPGATQKTLGFPEDGKQGGVWIMDAGTSEAHLMLPGR